MNIIIIGATSGIGKELAKIYISQSHTVGITGRRENLLNEFKDNRPNIYTCSYDVTQKDAHGHLMGLIKAMGGVDTVIYSSGFGKSNTELTLETELAAADVNVQGFMRHATTLFNYWCENNKKGHLAVLSSIAGIRALGIAPAYSATKHFQAFYLETLRQLATMRNANISFTAIKPGFVATDFISGKKYPLTLQKEKVAAKIVKAIEKRKKNCVIYGVWKPIALLMKLIPAPLWRGLIGRIISGKGFNGA
ncbi:MAG: SDR family NAD(P)-dependent oxidoreductase [Bacteroidales bacterium]|nr:SDR family NAD(P)-dependent oxidoreductase [Bacteroidales bacterium]